ncbi:MAG: hypothetical protein JWN70_6197 [Planctomycetaceae bacterium]|nr:hypothetical protein [Planctomycetaceae bacterium]
MGALLMLAPLVAVPILAVVGIPQFAPGNLIDLNGSKSTASSRDNRAFNEPRFGDDARHDADDLFAPLEESGSDVDGFDDPLAPRKSKSRGRNSRREADDQFDDGSTRSRGKQSSPFEENQDEEFGGNSTDDLNNGEEEGANSRPRNRQRPLPKNAPREFEEGAEDPQAFNEFDDAPNARTEPRGKRYADISPSFGGDKSNGNSGANPPRSQESALQEGQENAQEGTEEGNPFEAPPVVNNSRPAPSKKAPTPPRTRGPHDAPLFQPTESPPEAEADDSESFAPPPVAKAPNSGRRSPQAVVPPPQPPEVPAEPETPPAVAEEEQVPGVDELTWQDATKRLRALGVGKSKQFFTYLEDSNSFLFTCSAIHAKDPKKTLRFEAEAEEPLLAVSQVLEKLEAWQSSSPQRKIVARGQD